jgi:hypothetical protein
MAQKFTRLRCYCFFVSAAEDLTGFLAKYDPPVRRLAEDVLRAMRKRYPSAVQLVYDNYNALVVGFGPTERASDAVFSIALYPRWVTLFFLRGASIADPHNLFKGSGKIVRHIVLGAASDLDEPRIASLMEAAVAQAGEPFASKPKGKLVIKSVSAKQRSRRPSAL